MRGGPHRFSGVRNRRCRNAHRQPPTQAHRARARARAGSAAPATTDTARTLSPHDLTARPDARRGAGAGRPVPVQRRLPPQIPRRTLLPSMPLRASPTANAGAAACAGLAASAGGDNAPRRRQSTDAGRPVPVQRRLPHGQAATKTRTANAGAPRPRPLSGAVCRLSCSGVPGN